MIITDFGFKFGSKEYLVARELLAGTSREEVIRKFFPLVGKTTFIFRENVKDGRRQPKPLIDQRRLFLHHVNKTLNEMERKGWQNPEPVKDKIKWSSKERHWVRFRRNFIRDLERELDNVKPDPDTDTDEDEDEDADDNNPFLDGVIPEPGTVSPVILSKHTDPIVVNDHGAGDEEFDEKGNLIARWERDAISGRIIKVHIPVPPKPKTIADHIEDFYGQMMTARDFTNNRALSGEVLDFISTRALKDGCKAITHGVKVAHIMEAITKTWPDDAKRDLKNWKGTWKPKPSVIDFSEYPSPMPGAHQALGYVMCLAKARIPILLVGPSGGGKSFLARDLSDVMDMPYGELPLTAGATPSWLAGRETITGYKSVPFVEIYADGGIFCFEEWDAADPNMLLLVNNALANEAFTNPVTGQEIEKHSNFIAIATANTWGLGANREFTGRGRIDAASRDRFRAGRLELDYDEKVERLIVSFWKTQAMKMEEDKPKTVKKAKRSVSI